MVRQVPAERLMGYTARFRRLFPDKRQQLNQGLAASGSWARLPPCHRGPSAGFTRLRRSRLRPLRRSHRPSLETLQDEELFALVGRLLLT